VSCLVLEVPLGIGWAVSLKADFTVDYYPAFWLYDMLHHNLPECVTLLQCVVAYVTEPHLKPDNCWLVLLLYQLYHC
jgi:hypothetical protein